MNLNQIEALHNINRPLVTCTYKLTAMATKENSPQGSAWPGDTKYVCVTIETYHAHCHIDIAVLVGFELSAAFKHLHSPSYVLLHHSPFGKMEEMLARVAVVH